MKMKSEEEYVVSGNGYYIRSCLTAANLCFARGLETPISNRDRQEKLRYERQTINKIIYIWLACVGSLHIYKYAIYNQVT